MAKQTEAITRRGFLSASTGIVATAALSTGVRLSAQISPRADAPGSPPTRRRWEKSVVVKAQSDFVANAPAIRPEVLAEMFESALKTLAETGSAGEAWTRFLNRDDIVGLKFNPYGDRELEIADPLATVLVSSLIDAGWPAEQLVLVDAPPAVQRKFRTTLRQFGWTRQAVDFGSGQDQLAAFLDQVTAIINVPLLKSDNITGLSGCLKNITSHVIKHPARFHANGCAPYLADILSLRQISGKLRLNILNGLRTACHNGPLVDRNYIVDTGLLVLGRDPIAVDTIALETLNVARQKFDLPAIRLDAEHLPALIDAAEKGLGHVDVRKIKRLVARDS